MFNTKEHEGGKVVYKTPPNIAFVLGILSGITIASLVALGLMYSVLKTDANEGNLGTSNTNTKVAGVDTVNTNTAAPAVADPTPTKVDIALTADDHIRGDENAPVTLVEYSDFECSYCGRVQSTIDQLLEEYDGQVRLIFRHFPLSFHTNAQKAGEASECAADQGKFWEIHDLMFENQSALAVDDLKGYAADLGLNTSTFNDCLDNGTHATTVSDGLTVGGALGVQGTPATFVNGTLVSGAQPIESFKAVIDAALAE